MIAAATLAFALATSGALAWGDDVHKVVALIAQHYLTKAAKRQIDSLLAADTDQLRRAGHGELIAILQTQ
jgi:hypothetical protein